jgi:hypothetical protein
MILFFVIRTYVKDVKEIGKDDLAVPLSERLLFYFGMFGIPITALIAFFIYHLIF